MKNKKFYEVKQRGACLGYFKKLSNAKKYIKEFNTKVEVCPIRIVEREFMDADKTNSDAWNDENDSTSENGGV